MSREVHVRFCERLRGKFPRSTRPLVCPECMGPMKIIAFITEGPIIHKILRHLGLWEEETARAPPPKPDTPEIVWIPVEDTGCNVFSLHKWKTLGWAVPDQPDSVG